MAPLPESSLQTLLSATKSSDPSVRRAGRVFFAGLLGAFLLLALATWNVIRKRANSQETLPTALLAPPVPQKAGMARLGTFLVQLKESKEAGSRATGNTAEIELVLECELPRACKDIEENGLSQVRDAITSSFQPMDRSVFVTVEGKAQLRTDLIRKLQDAFPEARIKDLFFVNILME